MTKKILISQLFIFIFFLFTLIPLEKTEAFCSRVLIFDTWVCGGTCDGGQCGYQANGACGCIIQPTDVPEPGDQCTGAGGACFIGSCPSGWITTGPDDCTDPRVCCKCTPTDYSWNEFGSCDVGSQGCGYGTQRRTCNPPTCGGRSCPTDLSEYTQQCYIPCPGCYCSGKVCVEEVGYPNCKHDAYTDCGEGCLSTQKAYEEWCGGDLCGYRCATDTSCMNPTPTGPTPSPNPFPKSCEECKPWIESNDSSSASCGSGTCKPCERRIRTQDCVIGGITTHCGDVCMFDANCGGSCDTSGEVGGGDCTPDCSCASSTCGGSTCTDPTCGAYCSGTMACSGTVTAVAKSISTSEEDISCADLSAKSNITSGVSFALSPSSGSLSVSNGLYTWTGVSVADMTYGTQYSLVPTVTDNYAQLRTCVTVDGVLVDPGSLSQRLTRDGTINWVVGFGPPPPWHQTKGGNVYSKDAITSRIPLGISPRYFIRDAVSGGSVTAAPGLLAIGTTSPYPGYQFAMSGAYGNDLISSLNQKALSEFTYWDAYATYEHRLVDQTKNIYDITTTNPTQKPSMIDGQIPTIFEYTPGGSNPETLTIGTSGTTWTVNDNESFIFLVHGNLAINSPIILGGSGNGFIAFIVEGDITINPSVGVAYTSESPSLEGFFISGGTFHTGLSSSAGTEKFVFKGSIVADAFDLQRDLVNVSGTDRNASSPSELFLHNPTLYKTFPKILHDKPYFWQEVSP